MAEYNIQKTFEKYVPLVDREIKELLASQKPLLMYDMMSYFFGFLDENLNKIEGYGGKRFRPGITLLLADFYGVLEKALPAATAIEIFHNFTLIHDDVEDKDEYRRGRETVWKKWGMPHGVNTGDAQLILAGLEMQKLIDVDQNVGVRIQKFLNQKYLEIAEGQFSDFRLSELNLSDINQEAILEMIGGKSGILVGASAAVAGMVAGRDKKEIEVLWEYGYNLGVTYQICDDIQGIWGERPKTGKDELTDIREKKKTLPIIFARDALTEEDSEKLARLYDKNGVLSEAEINEVKVLLEKSGSKVLAAEEAKGFLKKIESLIGFLTLAPKEKEQLKAINQALFSDLGGGR